MAIILERHNDAVVHRDVVSVVPGLEGFDQNYIGVDVVCQHKVVVAAAVSDVEADHVVCAELDDRLTEDI